MGLGMHLQQLNLEQLVFRVIAALFAISVHELAHGAVAYKLGDPTPKSAGKIDSQSSSISIQLEF